MGSGKESHTRECSLGYEMRAAIISLVTKSTGQLENVQCKLEASVNTIRQD